MSVHWHLAMVIYLCKRGDSGAVEVTSTCVLSESRRHFHHGHHLFAISALIFRVK